VHVSHCIHHTRTGIRSDSDPDHGIAPPAVVAVAVVAVVVPAPVRLSWCWW